MKTLKQYLEEACKDYTHACVKVYRKDRTKPYKQISGDIDFVSNYFKKDHFGSLLILSGRFSPGECHLRASSQRLHAPIDCVIRTEIRTEILPFNETNNFIK